MRFECSCPGFVLEQNQKGGTQIQFFSIDFDMNETSCRIKRSTSHYLKVQAIGRVRTNVPELFHPISVQWSSRQLWNHRSQAELFFFELLPLQKLQMSMERSPTTNTFGFDLFHFLFNLLRNIHPKHLLNILAQEQHQPFRRELSKFDWIVQ